ncbi:MAG: hypothetical protein AB2693_33925 [Candidatus Thiodiazotropha sp.]
MNPIRREKAWDFLRVGVWETVLNHIHYYLGVLILLHQVSTSYGHPIGTYSQGFPIDSNSISGSPAMKAGGTFVDSLSVMFLRNVPVAIVVNSKGQIVGTLSSESFKATAQQTHANIPSLTINPQQAKPVKTRPVSKPKKDVGTGISTKAITVVMPKAFTKASASKTVKAVKVGKAINVKEATVKVAVSQNSSSLKAKALDTNEPVAVLNNSNSAGAGRINAKVAKATNIVMTSQSPLTKLLTTTGIQATTSSNTTSTVTWNVTTVTQLSANTTLSPTNTTVFLANTTVLPTNATSPTTVAAAFFEGLEYGEDYTTTPAPAQLLMGEGGEPLEPEELMAAGPAELR